VHIHVIQEIVVWALVGCLRAHRIGQKRPVTIYRLVAKDTIEEKIVDLHHHKRDLADSLLEGTDASGKLSTDELLRLMAEG
jgi:SNF2 family DNA or RNA helicase